MKDYSKCPECGGELYLSISGGAQFNIDATEFNVSIDLNVICTECDTEICGEQKQTIVDNYLTLED